MLYCTPIITDEALEESAISPMALKGMALKGMALKGSLSARVSLLGAHAMH